MNHHTNGTGGTGVQVIPIVTAVDGAIVVSLLAWGVRLTRGLEHPACAWFEKRTRHLIRASELGVRFDLEVDAFLLHVLSAYVSQTLGLWVLAIGLAP